MRWFFFLKAAPFNFERAPPPPQSRWGGPDAAWASMKYWLRARTENTISQRFRRSRTAVPARSRPFMPTTPGTLGRGVGSFPDVPIIGLFISRWEKLIGSRDTQGFASHSRIVAGVRGRLACLLTFCRPSPPPDQILNSRNAASVCDRSRTGCVHVRVFLFFFRRVGAAPTISGAVSKFSGTGTVREGRALPQESFCGGGGKLIF